MKQKSIACLIGVVLSTLCVWGLPVGFASPDSNVITGEIDLKEVSGATMLPGDRLLIITDEGNSVWLMEGATKSLITGTVCREPFRRLASNLELNDLEDVAWDRGSEVYLVTSHSRSRQGKNPDKRYQIARLQLEEGGKPKEPIAETSQKMEKALPQALRSATERTPAQSGLNIEGAAYDQEGHLLLGLRSPTKTFKGADRNAKLNGDKPNYEDAIVLRLENPAKLFSPSTDDLQVGSGEILLNLEGQGIRGMHYDSDLKGCWIVSGLSSDPNYELQSAWGLWFWDEKTPPVRAQVPEAARVYLRNPEAVCRITIQERPYLLLIDDGKDKSQYALFPVSNLSDQFALAGRVAK